MRQRNANVYATQLTPSTSPINHTLAHCGIRTLQCQRPRAYEKNWTLGESCLLTVRPAAAHLSSRLDKSFIHAGRGESSLDRFLLWWKHHTWPERRDGSARDRSARRLSRELREWAAAAGGRGTPARRSRAAPPPVLTDDASFLHFTSLTRYYEFSFEKYPNSFREIEIGHVYGPWKLTYKFACNKAFEDFSAVCRPEIFSTQVRCSYQPTTYLYSYFLFFLSLRKMHVTNF